MRFSGNSYMIDNWLNTHTNVTRVRVEHLKPAGNIKVLQGAWVSN